MFHWETEFFRVGVSACFYGAPGEIRAPDLVVLSHALKSVLQSMIIGIRAQRLFNKTWKLTNKHLETITVLRVIGGQCFDSSWFVSVVPLSCRSVSVS